MRDIKTVGDFVATIHFHKEVIVEIPVKVVDENAKAVEEEVAPVAEEAAAEAVEAPVAE